MSTTIKIPNGFITLVETEFNCPKCLCHHTEEDYYERLRKSKNYVAYQKCKECKTKLGVTTNITGDVVVWLKEDENKTCISN